MTLRTSLAVAVALVTLTRAHLALGLPPEEAFAAPPPEVHVGVWWHWMGGQLSREGIGKDLDWFVRMGITSATVFGMADCTMPWARRTGSSATSSGTSAATSRRRGCDPLEFLPVYGGFTITR